MRQRRNRSVYLQEVAMNLYELLLPQVVLFLQYSTIFIGGTFNAGQFYKTVMDKSCRHADITFYTQTGIHQQESPDPQSK